MSRQTENVYADGYLIHGYDYDNQAWVVDGKYIRCAHPDTMDCECFGKIYEGMTTVDISFLEIWDTEPDAVAVL